MKIEFEVMENDYINFNIYHLEKSKSRKNTFNLLRFFIPIIFSIPIYFIGTGVFKQPSLYWFIISIIFIAGWILTYPKQYKKLVSKEIKKILREGDNSSILGKKSLNIEDGIITVKGEFSLETISSENIQDIRIYDDIILVYVGGFVAHIIPRRYLDEDNEKNLLESLEKIKHA